MANQQITSQDGSKYLVINADGSINTSGSISVDAVGIKDGTTDTKAVVKNDGTDNALVVTQNVLNATSMFVGSTPLTSVPAGWGGGEALQVYDDQTSNNVNDVYDLLGAGVKVYHADECQRILTSDDAVTTINYSDATKTVGSNIVASSAGLGRKVTDTYDNSGATTLVLTRVVANA